MSIAPLSPELLPGTSATVAAVPELRISPVPAREPNPAVRADRPADDVADGQVKGQTPLTLVLPGEPRPARNRTATTGTVAGRSAASGTTARIVRPSGATRPTGATGANEATEAVDRTGVYPEPRAWAVRFVIAALEVSHGVRPADQLVRWTSPEVHATLARRAALAVRLRPSTPPGLVSGGIRVLGSRSCEPAPAICEVAVVVRDRDRIRAAALRLEGLGNRWRVTDLQIG